MRFLVVDDSATMRRIIVRYAEGDVADIIAAVEARGNDRVLKPFTPTVPKEKVDAILSVRAAA